MAHQIFGKRFMSVREPAWHGLGLSWTGPKTAVEAVTEAGIAEVIIGTRRMGWMAEDGTFTPADDKRVIVRYPTQDSPEYKVLGTAGEGYTVLQNTAIAAALDEGGLTGRWPVETCGALHDGATIFICLDMGAGQIAGEDHHRYALIHDKRDGTSSLRLDCVWTRVVCANTLQIALGEQDLENRITLEHDQHIGANFRFSLDVIDQVQAQSERVASALEALATL